MTDQQWMIKEIMKDIKDIPTDNWDSVFMLYNREMTLEWLKKHLEKHLSNEEKWVEIDEKFEKCKCWCPKYYIYNYCPWCWKKIIRK